MKDSAIEKLAIVSGLLSALGSALAELNAEFAPIAPKAAEPEAASPTETKPEVPPLKLEDVRAVLADIARSGKSDEMRTLLKKYGASKLSDIPADRYPELLHEAEAIRDA